MRLGVSDDGVGFPERIDLRKAGTLGLELVAALTRQLHAAVEVTRRPGTTFDLRFEFRE